MRFGPALGGVRNLSRRPKGPTYSRSGSLWTNFDVRRLPLLSLARQGNLRSRRRLANLFFPPHHRPSPRFASLLTTARPPTPPPTTRRCQLRRSCLRTIDSQLRHGRDLERAGQGVATGLTSASLVKFYPVTRPPQSPKYDYDPAIGHGAVLKEAGYTAKKSSAFAAACLRAETWPQPAGARKPV